MRFGSTIALSALLLVPAAARGQEPPAAKYVAQSIREVTIDVEGKRTTEPALVDLVETRVGSPLAMSDVRETIAHFHSLGRFEAVQVDVDAATGGVAVHYQLEPVHRVSRVEFKGELGVSEGTLRGWMSITLRRHAAQRTCARRRIHAGGPAPRSRLREGVGARRAAGRRAQSRPHDPRVRRHGRAARQDPQRRHRRNAARRQGSRPRPRSARPPDAPTTAPTYASAWKTTLTKMRRRGYYQASATDQQPTITDDGTQVDLVLTIFPGPLVKVQYDGDAVAEGQARRDGPDRARGFGRRGPAGGFQPPDRGALAPAGLLQGAGHARAPRGQRDADDRLSHSSGSSVSRGARRRGDFRQSGDSDRGVQALHQDQRRGAVRVGKARCVDGCHQAGLSTPRVCQRRGRLGRQRGWRGRAQADDRDQGRLERAGRSGDIRRAIES